MLSCQKLITHLSFNMEVKEAKCWGCICAISFYLHNCKADITDLTFIDRETESQNPSKKANSGNDLIQNQV